MPHRKCDRAAVVLNTEAMTADTPVALTGWRAMDRHGLLWLPDVEKKRRQALVYTLHFFTQPGWRQWILRTRWLAGLLGTQQGGAAFEPLFGPAWPGWQGLPDRGPLYLAARYGSPGPYRKLSVLFADDAGRGVAFVKVALAPLANEMVSREKAWLDRLGSIPALRGSVPATMQAGRTGDDQAYLMTTLAPGLASGGAYGEAHERFLSSLGRSTLRPGRFGDSMEAVFIADALPRLKEVLGAPLHDELAEAWGEASSALAQWAGPLVLAHRDFVPWNMRAADGRLFVFDWEYAADGASPLHDFFHFHLMPVAVSRWRRLRPDPLRGVIGKGGNYARRHYPDAKWDAATVSAWLLVYLLDVVLFYTDSGKLFDPRHPVLSGYTGLIRSRNRWMAGA